MKKVYKAQDVAGFNQQKQEDFQKTEIKDRLIFISHCLKPTLIEGVIDLALKLGYKKKYIFIVGGFTSVEEKLREFKNPPFIGIACPREIIQGGEALNNFCAQAIVLTVFKCPIIKIGELTQGESEVNLEEVEKILQIKLPTCK